MLYIDVIIIRCIMCDIVIFCHTFVLFFVSETHFNPWSVKQLLISGHVGLVNVFTRKTDAPILHAVISITVADS